MSEVNGDDTGQKSFMTTSPQFNFSDPNTFHDRVLLVEDKKFYVQSGYLMVWSDFFKGLFGANFKEANENEVELKDVSAEDFNNFLKLSYPTEFEITENNYACLINLAHRLLAPRVLELCQKFLKENFAKIDKITLLTVAFQNDMTELKDNMANFIAASGITSHGYTCKVCHFPQEKKPFCIHNSHDGRSACQVKAWIFDNIDRISELPSEIQSFVLRSSVWKF